MSTGEIGLEFDGALEDRNGFICIPLIDQQIAQLPVEPLAAGVLFARIAPAVAAPVTEGFDECFEQGRVGQYAAALAHRHVVSGIEADGGKVAKGSGNRCS